MQFKGTGTSRHTADVPLPSPAGFLCGFMGSFWPYSLQSGSDIHSICRTAQDFLGCWIKVLLNLVATTGMFGLCVLSIFIVNP